MGLRRHDTLLLTTSPNSLTLLFDRLARHQLEMDAAIRAAGGKLDDKLTAQVQEIAGLVADIQAEEDAPADEAVKEAPDATLAEALKPEALEAVATGAFDAVLFYNSSQSNKAIAALTFSSQSITSGTFSLTMPTNDSSNALIRLA